MQTPLKLHFEKKLFLAAPKITFQPHPQPQPGKFSTATSLSSSLPPVSKKKRHCHCKQCATTDMKLHLEGYINLS